MMTFNAAAYAMIAALAVFPTAEAGGTRRLSKKGSKKSKKGSKTSSFPSESPSSFPSKAPSAFPSLSPSMTPTPFPDDDMADGLSITSTLHTQVRLYVDDSDNWRVSTDCDDDSKLTCEEIYGYVKR
jgi:hypothetical protein